MDFSWIEDLEQRAKAEADYATSLAAKVAEEVGGLKGKNTELIEEKRLVAEKLAEMKASTEGINLEEAKEAMALLEKTKRKDLLEDGKLDEYILAQVQDKQREIERSYSSQLEVALNDNTSIAERATKYEGLFKNKIIEDAIRKVAMSEDGCLPHNSIIQDVIMRGKMVFSLNSSEDGIQAQKADGSMAKTSDGTKLLTPEAWLDDLKAECPHYFPQSKGTGASGGGPGASTGAKSNDLMVAKIKQALDAGDMTEYRRLRKEQGANLR